MSRVKQRHNISFYPILISATLITLYFNPGFADPFNSAKLYLLVLSLPILMIYIDKKRINLVSKIRQFYHLRLILMLFIGTHFILSFLSDQKYIAFFGEIQRQTGFIAYLGFSLFMYITAIIFQSKFINQMVYVIIFLSTLYVIYGLMQISGNDMFDWNNPYNSIIGTLGNPNFAGAFMAMLSIMCFGFLLLKETRVHLRLLLTILVVGLLVNIYLSNARQGLLSAAAGLFLIFVVLAFRKNFILGIISVLAFIFLIAVAILGMLQIGPLEKFLYKDTVRLRGFYWRAGLQMFYANPLTGVGIERYGSNFKIYREDAYPVDYGYELISTNAHNNFIQFFATGGIVLGLIYLILTFYIGLKGLTGIIHSRGQNQLILTVMLAAWVGFQAQAVVSIDNIGLTIWGWILGGIIIALSSEFGKSSSDNGPIFLSEINAKKLSIAPLVFSTILMVSFILVLLLAKSETNTFQIRNLYSSEGGNTSERFQSLASSVITDPLAQPGYKLEISNYLIQSGFESVGLQKLEELVRQDGVNPLFSLQLASMYEYKGRYIESIEIREKIQSTDPQNAKNVLQLARLYMSIGDQQSAINMKNWLTQNAPNSEELKLANVEIPIP
jgi:O-antigen ligase